MPEEVEAFLGETPRLATDLADFSSARIGDQEAVIASCGLGKVRAAMTASIMLERWNCRALVSAGTAGGLDRILPMQVVVAHEVVMHDYGRSRGAGELDLFRPGDPPLPEYQQVPIALSVPAERRRSSEAAVRDIDFVRFGTFASGDTFVNDDATRRRLIELGAVAVDMECAAVAQIAEYFEVPWLIAKGISDIASSLSHQDFLDGLAEASRRSRTVVEALLPEIEPG